MPRLADRKAIVTGGVRGIGRAIAEGFAAEGCDVAVLDVRPPSEAAPVLAGISAQGRQGLYLQADVCVEDEVRSAVDRALHAFGRIDVLVNNAGVVTESPLAELAVADWDRVMGVNLRGVFLCTRFVLPAMLEQGGGSIINMAS